MNEKCSIIKSTLKSTKFCCLTRIYLSKVILIEFNCLQHDIYSAIYSFPTIPFLFICAINSNLDIKLFAIWLARVNKKAG